MQNVDASRHNDVQNLRIIANVANILELTRVMFDVTSDCGTRRLRDAATARRGDCAILVHVQCGIVSRASALRLLWV